MCMLYLWGNFLGVKALTELDRLLKAGIINQEYVDIKVYYVDGTPHAAYYPTRRYTNRFYTAFKSGFPPELKIVRNKVPHADAQPRARVNFHYIDRYPAVDESLGLRAARCQDSNLDESK